MDILSYGQGAAQLWLLFMLRTLGFVAVVPLMSARSAPPQFRIVLVFFLTTLAFSAWMPRLNLPAPDASTFVPAAFSELLLGLFMGFIVGMVFVAFQFAGQFIGYQMGFAIVNVLDPQTQNQVSLVGEFIFTVVMLSFLNLNLHYDMLGLWHASYEIAPPGGVVLANLGIEHIVAIGDDLVLLALKVAVPLVAFLILTDVSLGIIARVMPQMNVFIVGIPIKIAMGLLFLSLLVLQLDPVVRQTTNRFINDAVSILHAVGT
ncbi:flagellar biosynthetic protein FliR [bacterium]|nr:flagellar biosynthetic protein FliR [bacterium]